MGKKFTFTFHGAAQEVGRSCIELGFKGPDKDMRILMDCGQKINDADSSFEESYPTMVPNLHEIDAVFISHAHLDHIGGLPYFVANNLNCPIYMNQLTYALTKILLLDSYSISESKELTAGYAQEHIGQALGLAQLIPMYEIKHHKSIRFKYYDAGHIPGSASMVLETNGARILYTGDIHTDETYLLHGTAMQYKDIDIMIIESTYGDRNHPNRKKEEELFIQEIKNTIQFGGSVLLPVFGVGRAQEILLMLAQTNWNVPMYLDGMAKKVTQLYLQHPGSVKSAGMLQDALNKVKMVSGWQERKEITKQQGIFITTAGMMGGGPVIDYVKRLHFDTKNAIFLTGYQAEGSNGRSVLESGTMTVDEKEIKVRGTVKKFDFSAHAGLDGLKKLIKKVQPKVLILNHGDPDAIRNLKEWCDFCKVYAPHLDEPIEIEV